MANPELAFGALAKPSKLDRDVAKHQRGVIRRSAKRAADKVEADESATRRRAIFKRDGGRCRATRRRLKLMSDNPMAVGHVHHIVFKSAGGDDSTRNLILIAPEVHEAIHQHRMDCEGNADVSVMFRKRNLETGKVTDEWHSPCPAEAK